MCSKNHNAECSSILNPVWSEMIESSLPVYVHMVQARTISGCLLLWDSGGYLLLQHNLDETN